MKCSIQVGLEENLFSEVGYHIANNFVGVFHQVEPEAETRSGLQRRGFPVCLCFLGTLS